MKPQTPFPHILGVFLAFGVAFSASATLVTVSSTETWDGTNNPHLVDGVTTSGSGTVADPYTYTIPNGMRVTSTGRINTHSPGDYSIKFVIQGGDLQMDSGAVLNVERYGIRTTPNQVFVMDLSGANSITGAGQIGPITSSSSTPRVVTIQNVKNVSLASIDLHVENVVANPIADRPLTITASGAVVVTGVIDNGDRQTGGNGGGDITIKAGSIDVNNLDTRGMRTTWTVSGNILLYALSPAGNYNPADSVNNAATNKLTVRGTIRTDGPGDINGNVTLQAVVLQLVFGIIQTPPSGLKDLHVGVTRGGATDSDLFVDVSSSGLAVSRDVQWGGTFTAPPGSPPAFTLDSFTRPNATQNVAYASTLVGTASDPDAGDTLTFSKGPGPAWLQVAANGTLSGTPALTDAGTNTWQVSVFDGTRFDTATLTIFVVAGPRFITGNFYSHDGVQNTLYTAPAETLTTNVVYYGYYGAGTLTYAKVSGPGWLTVNSDGSLTGTPDKTNVLQNTWVVSVTDGLFTNTMNLNIWLAGSPKFIADPILRATAYVSQGDYSVRAQTLDGAATDPQNVGVPGTLTWAKVSGPAWLIVNPDGTLAGTPTAGNIGPNSFTISAANAYPATTATLKINVAAAPGSGPVEVVNREIWDGRANPHAAEGVTLTGTGTDVDPATYTVPNGMVLYGNGQIYTTDYNTYSARRTETTALHIKFVIQGDLTIDAPNNGFVTAIRNRSETTAKRNLIFDVGGHSLKGRGTIVGIGYRALTPGFNPYAVDWDQDCPRAMTISNVVNVSLYEVNLQVQSIGSWTLAAAGGRPLLIQANGKVTVETSIDTSDRGGGSLSGQDVSVYASEITVSYIYTFAARTSSQTGLRAGYVLLKTLQPPGYLKANVNNTPANKLTIAGEMRADCTTGSGGALGSITTESVVLNFGPAAVITGTAPPTALSVGKAPPQLILGPAAPGQIVLSWMNAAKPTDVYNNASAIAATPTYVVDWTGTITPFVLQQNSDLNNPLGWVNAPSGTSNPGTNTIGTGPLFYRLKSLP
jgi:hypothetical protein